MEESRIAIYSKRLLTPQGLQEGTLLIEDGGIEIILEGRVEEAGYQFLDCENLVVMPGVIDPHVHINEPGRTEWEGFVTGTTAAVAGGVTTLVDMPLNSSPVTINVKELENKVAAAQGKMNMNCGFWGGIVPGNTEHLKPLADAGVLGFKAFLTHSGIDEFPNADEATMRAAYEALKGTNLSILAHCELVSGSHDAELTKEPTSYQAYLKSRPRKWENDAVALMIKLAEEFNHPTHIVHLSSSDPLDAIRAAKKRGVPLTVETCPHYIYFNAETIPDGDTRFKCAPPIREKSNNELLWAALIDGTLDFIGSDHSPATPDIKELETGNYQKAWGGISGIQYTLPAIWTGGQQHGLTLERLYEILCLAPAKFTGQDDLKGKLKPTYEGDVVIWSPEESFVVSKENMEAKHKISPYEGEELQGVVHYTIVNGHLVWNQGKLVAEGKGMDVYTNNEN